MPKSVYIFDDDEDILYLCTWLLEEMGWKVYTQTSCNNILERLKEVMPSVILMDNRIPETGGIVATQLIKADPALEAIPVIFFSANNDIKKLSEEAKADKYLAKPFDIVKFEQVVNSVL